MTSRKKAPKENIAQHLYNYHFAFLRRLAKEENEDLSLILSNSLPSESTYVFRLGERGRIPPPDTSKMKRRERELCLKEWHRPYYYEWLINEEIWKLTDAGFKAIKARTKGVRGLHKITQPRSADRQAPIIKERRKLIDSGVTDERIILKCIRKTLSDELPHYIQQTILAEKKKEADERRAKKPRALSP